MTAEDQPSTQSQTGKGNAAVGGGEEGREELVLRRTSGFGYELQRGQAGPLPLVLTEIFFRRRCCVLSIKANGLSMDGCKL